MLVSEAVAVVIGEAVTEADAGDGQGATASGAARNASRRALRAARARQ